MEWVSDRVYQLKWQFFCLLERLNLFASRVGRQPQTRGWEPCKSLVFDDSCDHEAWNRSVQQRVVRFVDFARPLYFPFNLLNKLVFFAIRRTRFVQEAVESLRLHRERTEKERQAA